MSYQIVYLEIIVCNNAVWMFIFYWMDIVPTMKITENDVASSSEAVVVTIQPER